MRIRIGGGESGRLRGIAGSLVAAAIAALAAAFFARTNFAGLWKLDAFDYAQIARELVQGNGFSSKQIIYNLHLRFLEEHGLLEGPWPNLHRFPLPSAAIAACYRIVGVGDLAVVSYGVVFHAATAALLFRWVHRALGPAPAIGAVWLFVVNGAFLESATSGLSEPPACFFFTLALYTLWRKSAGSGAPFLVGAALGLAVLSRANALLPLPFLAALAYRQAPSRRHGLAALALLLLGLVVVTAPWWIRNLALAGSPTFSLHSYILVLSEGTPPRKWDLSYPWVRDFVPPLEALRQDPELVWLKWKYLMRKSLEDFPTFAGTRLVPVAALGALALPAARSLRPLAWVVFASFALSLTLQGLTDMYFDRYYFHFFPAFLLLATGVVWTTVQPLGGRRPLLRHIVFAMAVLGATDLSEIGSAAKRVRVQAQLVARDHMDFIRENTADDAVIFSDRSHAVAWYGERRSIRTHYDRTADGSLVLDLFHFHDRYVPIDGMYLSAFYLATPWKRKAFRALANDPRLAQRFPRQHRFPDGALFLWRSSRR